MIGGKLTLRLVVICPLVVARSFIAGSSQVVRKGQKRRLIICPDWICQLRKLLLLLLLRLKLSLLDTKKNDEIVVVYQKVVGWVVVVCQKVRGCLFLETLNWGNWRWDCGCVCAPDSDASPGKVFIYCSIFLKNQILKILIFRKYQICPMAESLSLSTESKNEPSYNISNMIYKKWAWGVEAL